MSDKAWGIILNKLREMTSCLLGRVLRLPTKEATQQIKTKTPPDIGVPSENVYEWDRDNPWRQGHLLNNTDARALELSHPDFPDNTVVLVISHVKNRILKSSLDMLLIGQTKACQMQKTLDY
jgi:hypothetical protein